MTRCSPVGSPARTPVGTLILSVLLVVLGYDRKSSGAALDAPYDLHVLSQMWRATHNRRADQHALSTHRL
jgi:hypothetical protein